MKKFRIASLAAVAAASLVLAGCAADTATEETSTAAAGETVAEALTRLRYPPGC